MRRHFVRVVQPFDVYRSGHEICLDAPAFERVKGKGLVQVMYEEVNGERIEVDVDEGADARQAPAQQAETFPLDVLTDEERELILARRVKGEVKGEAKAKTKAKGETPTTPKE